MEICRHPQVLCQWKDRFKISKNLSTLVCCMQPQLRSGISRLNSKGKGVSLRVSDSEAK